jgi:glutamyl-tRNA synthetase
LEPIGEAEWNPPTILAAIKARAEAHALKLGDAMQPIRVALTGDTVSEPVDELLYVVGRDASLAALRAGSGADR